MTLTYCTALFTDDGVHVSSELWDEEQLQLLPLSRWLDLMILSEYSDILEHSIWQKKRSYLSEEFHRHFACAHNNMTSLIMQVILNITALLMLPGIKAKLPYVTLLLHKLETLHAYAW